MLQELVASMNIKDDLCQICSKFIALCDDEVVKDPIHHYSYHQTCYCCSLCRVSLSTSSSFEYRGKLYCARDYQVMKSRSVKGLVFCSVLSLICIVNPIDQSHFPGNSKRQQRRWWCRNPAIIVKWHSMMAIWTTRHSGTACIATRILSIYFFQNVNPATNQ